MTIHLFGLRAKMAARDEKRKNQKPGKGSANGVRFSVPQTKGGERETAEQRKERLAERRLRQLTSRTGRFRCPITARTSKVIPSPSLTSTSRGVGTALVVFTVRAVNRSTPPCVI